jgi:hypothetical protein
MCAIVAHATVFTGQYVECREIPGDTIQFCYNDSTTVAILRGGMNRLDTMVLSVRAIDDTTIFYTEPYEYVILNRDTVSGKYIVWDIGNAETCTMTVNAMGNVEVYDGLMRWYIMTHVPDDFRNNKVFFNIWQDFYLGWKKRLFE